MNFRHTAAQFFQNAADYLDPRAAWENKRSREIVAMHRRHAQGNYTGREWTGEEAAKFHSPRIKKQISDNIEKIKAAQKAGLI